MELPSVKEMTSLHTLAKNVDYTLRVHGAKSVLIVSDYEGEGKSTFLKSCAPVISELYEKKILIFDCQDDEKSNVDLSQLLSTPNLSYVRESELSFLSTLPPSEKISSLAAYFYELCKGYDIVFVNMKTSRRAEKTVFPYIPLDGAIIVRSKKSVGKMDKHVTEELRDREIPILGLVFNEGAL